MNYAIIVKGLFLFEKRYWALEKVLKKHLKMFKLAISAYPSNQFTCSTYIYLIAEAFYGLCKVNEFSNDYVSFYTKKMS